MTEFIQCGSSAANADLLSLFTRFTTVILLPVYILGTFIARLKALGELRFVLSVEEEHRLF